MDESEPKKEKCNGQNRRFDPELLKKGLRCDLDQYEMLKHCFDNRNMTEWNKWRLSNPGEDIFLEGANLNTFYLQGANLLKSNLKSAGLLGANLQGAGLLEANLQDANLVGAQLRGIILWGVNLQGVNFLGAKLQGAQLNVAKLQNANLSRAQLQGVDLTGAKIQGADFSHAIVDGGTLIWEPEVNRYRKGKSFTDFSGVGLDEVRIDPATKQLLEYNIRRKNWGGWYKEGPWWKRILKSLFVWPFWLISDYGLKTWRIIITFLVLAFLFALIYWLCPSCVMVNNIVGDIRGFWHALYFSVVTMTTLGFGDIAANPDSWGGQTLLMIQVILGYVLLGALVTRFAVLFTAGGPAGKFAKEN